MSTTVVRSPDQFWTTENGDLVPAKKVRRIRLAQDALSAAEEVVYDVLWGTKPGSKEESFRTVQAGYDFLVRKTRFSRKTIQRIVDKLLYKEFIEIHTPADIYSRGATIYRVNNYRSVLDRLALRQRQYVAKIGPGVVFVRKLETNLTTVDTSTPSTVVTSPLSTVDLQTTVTGVSSHMSTVANQTTLLLEQKNRESTPSAETEVRQLESGLRAAVGPVDDGAVRSLLHECRSRAHDATVEEILYFVNQKLGRVRNVQNPVGLLLVAIPRHFENGGHLALREQIGQEETRRRREWRDMVRFWETIAGDPRESEEARQEARRVLESLEQQQE